MKAVILAAGRGRRMGVLTEITPKPLIRVDNETLIEYVLRVLPTCITECVIVVGYRGDDIASFLGKSYHDRPISYVQQRHLGTGGGLCSAKPCLGDTDLFFVIGADDIFGAGELDKLVCGMASCGITYGVPKSESSFAVSFDDNGFLNGWHDVPSGTPRFYGVGAYVLSPEIFARPFYQLANGEYSIPHSLPMQSFPIRARRIDQWLPVNTQEDIEHAENVLKAQK